MVKNIDVINSLKKAKEILENYGHVCDVSAEDLNRYFEADTLYDDISLDEVLQDLLLVIHEILEIDEIKRMGLKITKDVIIKHHEEVDEAHLKAAEVELEIAKNIGDREHLKKRLGHVKVWCEDPLLPHRLKKRCKELYIKTNRAIHSMNMDELDAE